MQKLVLAFALLGMLAGSLVSAAPAAAATSAARLVILYGNDQNTSAKMPIVRPITYQVTTPNGNGVAGVQLSVTATGDTQLLTAAANLVSDTYGFVNLMVAGASLPGSYTISATFVGLPAPTTTTLTVLPFTRLNPRPSVGAPLSADTVDSTGTGTLFANISGGTSGPSHWRGYAMTGSATSAKEIPFPDAANGGLGGFAARAADGSTHLIYNVDLNPGSKMRYVRLSKGVFSTPFDLNLGTDWVIDGSLVASAGEVDFVYSTFDYQIRYFHLSLTGGTNVDRPVSAAGELGAWPSVLRNGSSVLISYTSFDDFGSYLNLEQNGTLSRVASAGNNVAASTLAGNGTSQALSYSDGNKSLFYLPFTNGAAGTPVNSALMSGSYTDAGRLIFASTATYLLATSGGVVSSVAVGTKRASAPLTLADYSKYTGLTGVHLASAPDSHGAVSVFLIFGNGNDGGLNAYLTTLNFGAACTDHYEHGVLMRGVRGRANEKASSDGHAQCDSNEGNFEKTVGPTKDSTTPKK